MLNEETNDQLCISTEIAKLVSGQHSITVGQYVLATKFPDADPNDPWFVGVVSELGIDLIGDFIRIDACGFRKWRYVTQITPDEGKSILQQFKNYL